MVAEAAESVLTVAGRTWSGKFESEAMKIVVISPHRDDVAFSLSLAVAGWIKQGHDVDVVCCFTRTCYAPLAQAVPAEFHLRMKSVSALRYREDEVWAGVLRGLCIKHLATTNQGRLRLVNLYLRDAPLRLSLAVDRVCSIPPVPGDSAMKSIEAYISSSGAEALVLPLAVGTHVDHVTARDAGLRVLDALGGRHACAFYEDLPYAARPGAAEGLAASVNAIGIQLCCGLVGLAGDAGQAEAWKLRAVSCYRSQVSAEEMQSIAVFCQRYGGRERLWANTEFWDSPLASVGVESQEATLV